MNWRGIAAMAVYVSSIVLANYLTSRYGLVGVGFGLQVTAGTFAAGFALLARDGVQQASGRWWVLGGIAVGGALSWWLASAALAAASVAAFLVSELADTAVYTALIRRGFATAAIGSNLVSAPLDTVVFLVVAGFPLTWQILAGQLIAKLLWATLLPVGIYLLGRHALLRKPVVSNDP